VTFRRPGPLAISVAGVDQMSGGRVELGLGGGWNDDEHRAYGIPFPPTRERFEMLEEQLAIITGLWRTPIGERFGYEGRHHRVADSPALPKPVQADGVPIIIGGWGAKRTPQLAARYAAEYNLPFGPVSAFADQNAKVTQACEVVGRDPATLVRSVATTVCCGADEAEVERRAAAIGQDLTGLRANQTAGTSKEVIERLQAFADAGAERVYLQVLDLSDLDHLRLLAAEVLPQVS
jgi:alkanesulfonate monooxygenase SsuD/methylene tetrahydromethanopterin reductase-like flavin-dependent oxidoreductase (luciferase family)